MVKANRNANSDMKAVAPKTSPVRPPNFCFDMLPIKKITTNINRTPNKMLTRGKKKVNWKKP